MTYKARQRTKRAAHVFTVRYDTFSPLHPWRVDCSCGLLSMPVPESEVGMLIRIHWDLADVDAGKPVDQGSDQG